MAFHLFSNRHSELHTYNDSGSEANALICSAHFFNEGLLANKLMCFHDWSHSSPYGRYPALPELIMTATMHMGFESLAAFRVIPILLSLSAVILFFALVQGLFGSVWIGLGAALFYGFNVTFLKNADNFHQFPLSEFFRMLTPLLLFQYFRSHSNRRNFYLAAYFISYFLLCSSTWEYAIGTSILSLAIYILEGRRAGQAWRLKEVWAPWLWICALTPALVMCLTILKNGWYYNDLWGGFSEMLHSLIYRRGGKIYTEDGAFDFTKRELLKSMLFRFSFVFGFSRLDFLGFGLAFIYFVAKAFRKGSVYWMENRRRALYLGAFALANASFILLLPQWAFHHFGLAGIRHLLPTYALIAALVTIEALRLTSLGMKSTKPQLTQRALNGARTLVFLILGYQVLTVGAWNLRDSHKFFIESDQHSWAADFKEIDEVKKDLPSDALVFGNTMWRPEIRYRIGRPAVIAENTFNFFELMKSSAAHIAPYKIRYFLFYERWGDPERYLPNYAPYQKELEEKSRELFTWLKKNGLEHRQSGRWHLWRIPSS